MSFFGTIAREPRGTGQALATFDFDLATLRVQVNFT